MYVDLGTVRPGTSLFVPFHTFDSNDPSASVTITGLATTDIEVYKDASMTQRASDSGYALVDTDGIDIDTTTGIHGVTIDLADNTTAGFWAAGSDYVVVIASITVDAATINFIPIRFRIGYAGAVLNTTIATLASQTSFTLTSGPAEDDALNGMWCWIHDVASAVQCGYAIVSDYTGSTKTVTLAAGTTFTAAASDNISIMGPMPMQPTVAARTLDVTATGAAGIDWGNVENQSTSVDLSATDIQLCDTITTYTGNTVQTGDTYALANGATGFTAIDTVVDAIKVKTDYLPSATAGAAGGVFIAGTNAATTITTALTTTFTGNLTGSVGSVTGAVDVGSINGVSAAAVRLALSAGVMIPGTVDSTGFTMTTTEFEADDITEATAQHYNGRVIIFTSGALIGQATSISNYSLTGGRGHFTVVALTEAAANNDTFLII